MRQPVAERRAPGRAMPGKPRFDLLLTQRAPVILRPPPWRHARRATSARVRVCVCASKQERRRVLVWNGLCPSFSLAPCCQTSCPKERERCRRAKKSLMLSILLYRRARRKQAFVLCAASKYQRVCSDALSTDRPTAHRFHFLAHAGLLIGALLDRTATPNQYAPAPLAFWFSARSAFAM